jgi:hypothetical protein
MQLVQRREVWVPTAKGWLLLVFFSLALGLASLHALYPWLAVSRPVGGQVLIVEGWMGPAELNDAAEIYRSGHYTHVITTGGPLHAWPEALAKATFADRAAQYLSQKGVPAVAVPSPITPHDRTWYSAVMVREWAQRAGITLAAVDVVSVGAHARRSRLLYERALGGGVEVGIVAVRPRDYDPSRWWRSSAGARDVFDQATGLAWVEMFFRP